MKLKHTATRSELRETARLLARWYSGINPALALENMFLFWAHGGGRRQSVAFAIDLLRRLERHDDARVALRDAIAFMGEDSELCLAASNLTDDKFEKLGWINRMYKKGGLAPVTVSDRDVPLSIQNLIAPSAPQNRDSTAPKVSVIMPAYNAVDTISGALESICRQTWYNLEIIVVDDASTDGTQREVLALMEKDQRIALVHNHTNMGCYVSRNVGLARATGDLITVQDADDWSHPQRVSLQVDDILDSDSLQNISFGTRLTGDFQFEIIGKKAIIENTSSLMVRRHALAQLGGWDEVRFGADSELYERLMKAYQIEYRPLLSDQPLALLFTKPTCSTKHQLTGIASIGYGVRQEYKEAYRFWHRVEESEKQPNYATNNGRRFPVPALCLIKEPEVKYELLFISDFAAPKSFEQHSQLILDAISNGRRAAVFHWPIPAHAGLNVKLGLRQFIHAGLIDATVPGERICCDLVIWLGPSTVLKPPCPAPDIHASECIMIQDEPDTAGLISGAVKAALHTANVVSSAQVSWERLERI